MKPYIDSALNTINTPLYRELCLNIIKKPMHSNNDALAIKKMLLNNYYSSTVSPFENLELNNADYAAGIMLWLGFSGHTNPKLLDQLSKMYQYADEYLVVLTIKMVGSLQQSSFKTGSSGIWKDFIYELDKSISLHSKKTPT